MFLSPEIRDFLLSIQRISPSDIEKMSTLFEFRIIGFGIYFFGVGVISGFALIVIGILFRTYSLKRKQIVFLSLKFLIILVVGMMMARTTLVGGLLGLFLIFFPRDFKATISMFQTRMLFLLYIVVIPIIVTIILVFVVPQIAELAQPVFNFAFKIFINYFEKGSLTSASTNRLMEMYIYPETIKTWLIGDGLWNNPNGAGYYMHTDVGYLRLIYYFGLTGLMAFLGTQYYLISKSLKNYNINIVIYGVVFSYLLILNLKGFADLLSFMLLYWMGSNLSLKENRYVQ